jgi:hypothetical protein
MAIHRVGTGAVPPHIHLRISSCSERPEGAGPWQRRGDIAVSELIRAGKVLFGAHKGWGTSYPASWKSQGNVGSANFVLGQIY